jgi:hypothetical protein
MQVYFLSGLANSVKKDYEPMAADLKRARELFVQHQCEEPGILEDIDRMLASIPPAAQPTATVAAE